MAPVTIRHIVSFSSQDPKHPVENLLIDSLTQPWLSCPRDRSRQLRVEVQLDHACHIGYIDIGNSGSAFLQIDVGRSIWALDKGFTALLPTTTLMTPADARSMKNDRGVRMFKEGDFLVAASLEKWDRVRVTCTQPFNKQQFGLSFIRVRSTEDEERRAGCQGGCSSPVSPLHSREKPTLDAQDPEAWSQKLRDKLQSTASPPPASMSRSVRMLLLSAAKSRKRRPPIAAARSPAVPPSCGDNGSPPQEKEDSPLSSSSCPETLITRLHPSKKGQETPCRRLKLEEAQRRKRAQTHSSENHRTPRKKRDRPSTAQPCPETDTNTCPICAGHFPTAQLLLHAASCGEASGSHWIVLSSSDDDDDDWDDTRQRPGSWVQCPLCGFPFQEDEIEGHASRCGE